MSEVGEESLKHKELICWFKTIPLWLDMGSIRIVHACWNDEYMRMLQPLLGTGQTLTEDLLLASNKEGTEAFVALETLCKGPEISLPNGSAFFDKDGHRRTRIRIRWWEKDLATYRKAALVSDNIITQIPDTPVLESQKKLVKPYEGVPVFFGHYWRQGEPLIFASNIACVDYSAGIGGPLVAYRWEGEEILDNSHLLYEQG